MLRLRPGVAGRCLTSWGDALGQKESDLMANGASLPQGIAWTVKGDQLTIVVDMSDTGWTEPKTGAEDDAGRKKNEVKSSGGFQPAGHGASKFLLNVIRPNQS